MFAIAYTRYACLSNAEKVRLCALECVDIPSECGIMLMRMLVVRSRILNLLSLEVGTVLLVTREQTAQLEGLVDKGSLCAVLAELAEICMLKAEHIEDNWQDAPAARQWREANRIVERAYYDLHRRTDRPGIV